MPIFRSTFSLLRRIDVLLMISLILIPAAGLGQTGEPLFSNVTVHDPSVVRVDGTYYIFGSHLAVARSDNLMQWTQISTNPNNSPLFNNPWEELSSAVEWTSTSTDNAAFWAPDVIQLGDGRFYFYYCTGILSGPRGALGLAVADHIEGPYQNVGVMLRSSASGFNANIHPNSVDPHTFFDHQGRLWMVYGSYSGGIFILRMDPTNGQILTGRGAPDQGWGTRLTGGYHPRIEAPYILYSPDTGFYYLFLSFGGLGADGGYQMRVARSENPHGPYFDSEGNNMVNAAGTPGTLFDDDAIAPYGVKLMGNFRFLQTSGESSTSTTGYVSPGHNSAFHDKETGKYYLIFHTRFVGTGNQHRVRVHQMYMNEDGWPVVAPHRYAGEFLDTFSADDVAGTYKIINHGKDITTQVKESIPLLLAPDFTIREPADGRLPPSRGTWEVSGRHFLTLILDDVAYQGVVSTQWDNDNRVWIRAFSALSEEGVALWGSRVSYENDPPLPQLAFWRLRHFGQSRATGIAADDYDANRSGLPNLVEYALGRNPLALNPEAPVSHSLDNPESRLTISFHRIADPHLTYKVEATSTLTGTWEPIWHSTGADNNEGPVTVQDTEPASANQTRFLRLTVSR